MSEDNLESLVKAYEAKLGRSLTAQEFKEFVYAWNEARQLPNAYEKFAHRLKARQGTSMPDFDALYRRKAELDGEQP